MIAKFSKKKFVREDLKPEALKEQEWMKDERTYDELDPVTKKAVDDFLAGKHKGKKRYDNLDDYFNDLGVKV